MITVRLLGPVEVLAGDEVLEALTDARLRVAAIDSEDELAEALRRRREAISNFGCIRHGDRVHRKLRQLARDHGRVVPGGIRLDLPLTHELLGGMVGSARETVTWALAELAREGFVQRHGRSYHLTVPPEALAS